MSDKMEIITLKLCLWNLYLFENFRFCIAERTRKIGIDRGVYWKLCGTELCNITNSVKCTCKVFLETLA